MKNRFSEKHPYIASVGAGILCTFMTALGMAISQILGLGTDMQLVVVTIFLILSVLVGMVIMKITKKPFADYGFRKSSENTLGKVWYYIPLILMELLPIFIGGFSAEVTFNQYFLLLAFVIAVGCNEEIYFRGLAYSFLLGKGKKVAIVVSSIIFGILHLANALSGKNMLYLVLQVAFAFLVGLALAEVFSITKSLWLLIAWHAVHDYIANITSDSLDARAMVVIALQMLILLIYVIGMWRAGTELNENEKEESLK